MNRHLGRVFLAQVRRHHDAVGAGVEGQVEVVISREALGAGGNFQGSPHHAPQRFDQEAPVLDPLHGIVPPPARAPNQARRQAGEGGADGANSPWTRSAAPAHWRPRSGAANGCIGPALWPASTARPRCGVGWPASPGRSCCSGSVTMAARSSGRCALPTTIR